MFYKFPYSYIPRDGRATQVIPSSSVTRSTLPGLPVPKINLRHGTLNNKDNETCTACAGTLYMEFAALSRFTGNGTYENKARAALDYLYKHRAPGGSLYLFFLFVLLFVCLFINYILIL